MLIKPSDPLEQVFRSVRSELIRGALDKKHPYRYMVMSTLGTEGIAARYVVLRKVDEDLNLYFYTDSRTGKISQLKENNGCTLLGYHPSKKAQLRLNGRASIHCQDELAQEHWKNVQGKAQKAYNPEIAPGKSLSHPTEAHTWPEVMTDQYFAVIVVSPFSMEVLQLDKLEHTRAQFDREGKVWNHQWIAP